MTTSGCAENHPPPTADTHVTTDSGRILAAPAEDVIGVADPYSPTLFDDVGAVARVRDSGIRAMGYLSGSAPDLFDFRTGTLRVDPDKDRDGLSWIYPPPPASFDKFASFARDARSSALVHVDYGTGTPDEAAAWVRYANRTNNYGIRNWEIGEESYLNGSGPAWAWPDAHKNPDGTPEGPTSWAHNAAQFVTAMRQADPAIRIGIPVAPLFPATAGGHAEMWNAFATDWNNQVLAVLGPLIDFVDLHWYPQREETDDAALLAAPRAIGALSQALRQQLVASGSHADILVGETNSSAVSFGKQAVGIVNALFLVDDMLTWLEQGALGVDWYAWQIAMAADEDHPQLHGDANFGTIGLLSTGGCVDTRSQRHICEPARNTPFAPYYTLELVSHLMQPGTRLLEAQSDNPSVITHALSQPDGTITVVLINTDPAAAHRVQVQLPGSRLDGDITVTSFGDKDNDLRTEKSEATTVRELAPYSVTAVTYHPAR
ncbi:hypothetical protein [Nocardia sp. NPDC050175]|uniref:hypothetical protein n=1 Tax=Nocardia sp. NPDC050175 TaxID=3364317 RepID=UPI0037A3C468